MLVSDQVRPTQTRLIPLSVFPAPEEAIEGTHLTEAIQHLLNSPSVVVCVNYWSDSLTMSRPGEARVPFTVSFLLPTPPLSARLANQPRLLLILILVMHRAPLRFGSLLIVIVAVLAATELCSSQAIPLLRPKSDWAIRVDTAERPLSGEIVLGAMVGDQNATVEMERISLRVPSRLGSILCVTVTARDARFRASAQFDLPRVFEHGPIRLAAITDAYVAGVYRRARIQDLAILVEIGASCNDPLRRIVPANWGEHALHGAVYVYANTEGSSSVRWISVSGNASTERCLPFSGGGSVAYNVFCTLPGFTLGSDVSAAIVQSANARGDARVPFRLTYFP